MLSIDSITKYYGDVIALSEMSTSLQAGDVVGLVGLNGAGKSTLLKGLAGEFAFSQGKIVCHGICRDADPQAYRYLFGYQPERPFFPGSFTVLEFAQFISRIYARVDGLSARERNSRIEEYLDRLRLSSFRNAFCHELSQGEQQRTAFLGAVLHEPKVLLLDEPFNGLDPRQMMEFRDMISQSPRERITILSSHLMSEVQSLCNRILILDKGELVVDQELSSLEDRQLVEDHFALSESISEKVGLKSLSGRNR